MNQFGSAQAFTEVDFIAARYPSDQLVMAGPGRRLAGALIDGFFLALAQVMLILTFVFAIFMSGSAPALVPIGLALTLPWLVWFVVVAPAGQTPGKQLLGMYIMKADGTRAGGGYVWLRELVIKGLLGGILNSLTFGIYWVLAAFWCIWDKNRQCIWDKLGSTYIAYSPLGFRPLTANELAARGLRAPAPVGFGAQVQPQIIINNNNNNRLQVGDDYSSHQVLVTSNGASAARVGVIDAGRPLPDIQVSGRDVLIVGRDASADIRISDSRASRRHLEIRIDGSTWIVRDLGAMNPARVISSRGEERQVQGGTTRLEHGQLAVGDSIITLYPLNGRN